MIYFNNLNNRDEFNLWLNSFNDVSYNIEVFINDNVNKLNYDQRDFDIIEKYIFNNFEYKEHYNADEIEIFNLLHYYLGEIFIKEIECAYWEIDFKDKNNFFYKIPTIHLKNKMGSPISPYNLILTSLYRKEKGLLKKVFKNLSKYCS